MLYHGYSDPKYASMALSIGKMAATSTQRFWADGRRRTEDEPDYKQSYWMKGISFTRDIHYAMSWGEVVFGIDQAKLAQRTKVVPFSWAFHMSGQHTGLNLKKEREEFAIIKATPDDYNFPAGHEQEGDFDIKRFMSKDGAEGYVALNPILAAIWLHADIGSTWSPHDMEYDATQNARVRKPGLKHEVSFRNREMTENGHDIEQIIAHPKFKGYFTGGKRGDSGFKFYPADTPRDKLPPRDF